jgi:hypothetical protein
MFIPRESDKAWLRNLLSLIKVGGSWGTDWAVYRKVDETSLAVLTSMGTAGCEENIDRVRIVCEAIGVTFLDGRAK